MRRSTAAAVLALSLLAPATAHGHGLEPALLALREIWPGRFEVVWKSSKARLPGAEVRPLLPAGCRQTADPPTAVDDGDRVRLAWTVDCGVDGLVGQSIGVADLDVATIDALLQVERLDGGAVQTVLTARHPSWTVPRPAPRADGAAAMRLGAERALAADRLLLLAGLLLALTAAPMRLLQAAAAFLLGHGLALALVAVGAVAPPPRAVELGIALSLLCIALFLTRRAPGDGRRRPWTSLVGLVVGLLSGSAIATSFGAVAGGEGPLALLAFGTGTALVPVAAVALVAGVGLALRRRPGMTLATRRGAGYAMGILAVFWCLERLAF